MAATHRIRTRWNVSAMRFPCTPLLLGPRILYNYIIVKMTKKKKKIVIISPLTEKKAKVVRAVFYAILSHQG
jgi:hypothetical protein